MLTSLCSFLVDWRVGVGHSILASLGSGLVALALCALWHLGRVLWKARVVTGLYDGDPRITVIFIDERKEVIPTAHCASLELKNSGDSDALWVRIAPLKLQRRTLYFTAVSPQISPTDYSRFYAEVGDQWGSDRHHDLIRAMSEEWSSRLDCETHREVVVPMRIDYENADGVFFQMSFEMLYHGGKGLNQPNDFKCIECRKFTYRRIVPGGYLASVK